MILATDGTRRGIDVLSEMETTKLLYTCEKLLTADCADKRGYPQRILTQNSTIPIQSLRFYEGSSIMKLVLSAPIREIRGSHFFIGYGVHCDEFHPKSLELSALLEKGEQVADFLVGQVLQ